MSHLSNNFHPNFSLVVQEPTQQFRCDATAQQTNNNIPQQWRQSKPRSVQLNVPSPTASVRSTVTAPVYHRSFDHSELQQSNVAAVNNRPNNDLLGMELLTPSGHAGRSSYSLLTTNYNEESWNPFNLRTSGLGDDTGPFSQSNVSLKSFRHGPESVASAAPISDSGFYSQSVISHDVSHMDQPRMQWNLAQQVDPVNVRSITSEAPRMVHVHSDYRSQISRTSSRSGYEGDSLTCSICGDISKCNSDFKFVLPSM
jgi:hypothetical protein